MIIFIVLLLIDQLVKILVVNNNINITVIKNVLAISITQNTGVVFGFLQGANIYMIYISIIVCVVFYIYGKKYFSKERIQIMYVILAGGIGNLIDRIFRGHVIDYIDTPYIATFNLADAYVVIGVTLLIILELLPKGRIEKNR